MSFNLVHSSSRQTKDIDDCKIMQIKKKIFLLVSTFNIRQSLTHAAGDVQRGDLNVETKRDLLRVFPSVPRPPYMKSV